jgi:uncharacterized damage-inducible protein DinB
VKENFMATETKTELEMFLATWDREVATTLRVLKNFPAGQDDFKPVPSSASARDLAWIFVLQEKIIGAIALGELESAGPAPTPAIPVAELVAQLEASYRAARAAWEKAAPGRFDAQVKFPVPGGGMGDLRVGDVAWMFLLDNIHHRGQISVYLRMLGAKVPPIYGPNADGEWAAR